MVNSFIVKEIQKSIATLTQTEQNKVLAFIRSLQKSKSSKSGVLDYFGSISHEEAKNLKNVINRGCEKIDYNEW
jgi:hypothetical protein